MKKNTKNISARFIALNVLLALEKSGFRTHLDDEFFSFTNKNKHIHTNDKNLAYEIISGCVRNKSLLNFYLSKYSSQPVEKIEQVLRIILITAFYQILFLDKIPDHAIVNEAVNLCKQKKNAGWGKFTNAILRNALRDNVKNKNYCISEPAVLYSHPAWLVKKFELEIGKEKTVNILKWNNKTPEKFFVIINNFEDTVDELIPEIAEPTNEKNIFKVLNFSALISSSAFINGNIYLITPWSAKIARQLPLNPGMKILDMCAAPGGKSILTACRENVEIIAADNSPRRIEKLKENLARCKIGNVKPIIADGRNAEKIFGKNSFDAALLDAPCSSIGVIRNHPEIKWRLDKNSFTSRKILQKQLLESANKITKAGGYILYSVCSFSKEESTDVIDEFLFENKDMECIKKKKNLPGEKNMNGGFFCLMKKNN